MSIRFHPKKGAILICDYDLGGFILPEMQKRRPVVVVSPRLHGRDQLCSVVPLSTTGPTRNVGFVVKIDFDHPLPKPFDFPIAWAKCDMISTVCFKRLEFFRSGRDQYGKRKYFEPNIGEGNLIRIKEGMKSALDF
jgi:uncharacterized protein YifN (PemK superfamily)